MKDQGKCKHCCQVIHISWEGIWIHSNSHRRECCGKRNRDGRRVAVPKPARGILCVWSVDEI
jgi:hypothetical protein